MKPFYELKQAGQTRRLQKLAVRALMEYPIDPVNIKMIRNGHNAVFRVCASTGENSSNNREFALRICRPRYQSQAQIHSEMIFLNAIRENTNLKVAIPIQTKLGDWLANVQVEVVPEARNATLFRWQNGRLLRKKPGKVSLESLGAVLATLHNFAENWATPIGFDRKRWDSAGMSGDSFGVDVEEARSALPRELRDLIDSVNERGWLMMNRLGEGREVFGVIHADLHLGNSLFQNGDMIALDFDDCGWGYYLYDIAVPFSSASFFHRQDYQAMRGAILRGYRRVRSLSDEHLAWIETFVALRHAAMMIWMMGNRHEIFVQELITHRISQYAEAIEAFLKTGSCNIRE